jgi:hypothetical protein
MAVLISKPAMSTIRSAACILGLSHMLLRVWIDDDLGQALHQLTRIFLVRWMELMHSQHALRSDERIIVQDAIGHLHLGAMVGSGLQLGDYKSVRNSILRLLDHLGVAKDTLDVRGKIMQSITKIVINDSDGAMLGGMMVTVRSVRGPRRPSDQSRL